MELIKESFSTYDPQTGEYAAEINIFGEPAELYGHVQVIECPHVGADRMMFGKSYTEEVNLELERLCVAGEEIEDSYFLNQIKNELELCQTL